MGISLSSCVSGTRFSSKWWCQQVCMGIAWLQWAMANGSSDNVEIRIFPWSVHILSHLAWGQCLVCCATMEACWHLTLWFSSSLGFLEVLCLGEHSYRIEILFVKECVGVEKLLCWFEMTWIYMNRGRSREVCINVGLCLQSSSSTTGGLPESEGKRDE
jgi:hypothetical protein